MASNASGLKVMLFLPAASMWGVTSTEMVVAMVCHVHVLVLHAEGAAQVLVALVVSRHVVSDVPIVFLLVVVLLLLIVILLGRIGDGLLFLLDRCGRRAADRQLRERR